MKTILIYNHGQVEAVVVPDEYPDVPLYLLAEGGKIYVPPDKPEEAK
jgi:hypothetical protein